MRRSKWLKGMESIVLAAVLALTSIAPSVYAAEYIVDEESAEVEMLSETEEDIHTVSSIKISKGDLGAISALGKGSHGTVDYMVLDNNAIVFNTSYGQASDEKMLYTEVDKNISMDDAALKALGFWLAHSDYSKRDETGLTAESKRDYTLAQCYIWYTLANGKIPTTEDTVLFNSICGKIGAIQNWGDAPKKFLEDVGKYYEYYVNGNESELDPNAFYSIIPYYYVSETKGASTLVDLECMILPKIPDYNYIRVTLLDDFTRLPAGFALLHILKDQSLVDAIITDYNGVGESARIRANSNPEENVYSVVVTIPPDGYDSDDILHEVVLDAENEFTECEILLHKTVPEYFGCVKYCVQDQEGDPVAGVTINLCEKVDEGDAESVLDTVTTDAAGKAESNIEFVDAPTRDVYAKFVDGSERYVLPTELYAQTILADRTVEYAFTVQNLSPTIRYEKAVRIKAVDQASNDSLEGAVFQIYESMEDVTAGKVYDTITTNGEGIAETSMKIIEDKTVYAVMTQAPTDYFLNETPIAIFLAADEGETELCTVEIVSSIIPPANLYVKVVDDGGNPVEDVVIDIYQTYVENADNEVLESIVSDVERVSHTCYFDEENRVIRYLVVRYVPSGYVITNREPIVKEVISGLSDEENTVTIILGTEDISAKDSISVYYKMCDTEATPAVNNVRNLTSYPKNKSAKFAKPTRKGYVFGGWYKDSRYRVALNGITGKETRDVTVYAKWTEISYKLSFHANKGKFTEQYALDYPVKKINLLYTTEQALPTDMHIFRNGYLFAGWNTKANGKGTFYEKSASKLRATEGNITLYAAWEALEYSVEYHLNDTEDYPVTDNPNQETRTVEKVLSLKAPTREGYTFKGWYDNEKLAGKKLTSVGKTCFKDLNLYASWAENSYKVKLSAGSKGRLNEEDIAYQKGVKVCYTDFVNLPVAEPRAGYTFIGWNTKPNGSGEYISTIQEYTAKNNATITLYAIYL